LSVQTEATDQRQAAVYRLYDSAGTLLYIGSSYNPERRYRDHYPKPWWPLVARREEEWHPSKEAAYVVEMTAIAAEAPVHNEMGTPRYVPPSEKAAARRSHLAGELTVKGIMAKHSISRQSLHTYRQRPDFPAPVSRPGAGGLRWRQDEVAAWFEANPPRQGKRTDLVPPKPDQGEPVTSTVETREWRLTPETLDQFVRALVNHVDYDIHKGYECGEEDGFDHYPELVAEAAEMLDAIVNGDGESSDG
jgi:predicted DNA-binding transcriptional regulator AlpA